LAMSEHFHVDKMQRTPRAPKNATRSRGKVSDCIQRNQIGSPGNIATRFTRQNFSGELAAYRPVFMPGSSSDGG
jgi:hypothetical protein